MAIIETSAHHSKLTGTKLISERTLKNVTPVYNIYFELSVCIKLFWIR